MHCAQARKAAATTDNLQHSCLMLTSDLCQQNQSKSITELYKHRKAFTQVLSLDVLPAARPLCSTAALASPPASSKQDTTPLTLPFPAGPFAWMVAAEVARSAAIRQHLCCSEFPSIPSYNSAALGGCKEEQLGWCYKGMNLFSHSEIKIRLFGAKLFYQPNLAGLHCLL